MTKFEVGKFYKHKFSEEILFSYKENSIVYAIILQVADDKNSKLIGSRLSAAFLDRTYYEEVTASFKVKKLAPVRLSQLSKDSKFKFSGNCPETYVIKAINFICYGENFICYGEIGQYICAYINEEKPDEILLIEASIQVIPVE